MTATRPFRYVAAAIQLGLANRCALPEITAAVLEGLRASVDDEAFKRKIDEIREGMPPAPYKVIETVQDIGPKKAI